MSNVQGKINDAIYSLWCNHPYDQVPTGRCPTCKKLSTKGHICAACAEFDLAKSVGYKDAKAYHDTIRKLRKLEDKFKRIIL